jgi:hypothetical protein
MKTFIAAIRIHDFLIRYGQDAAFLAPKRQVLLNF